MAEETTFVYMNLNSYPVVISGPYGGPLTVPRNKAVKGDYFARFAQPSGSLAMINERLVAPAAIIAEIKPNSETTASIWADQKAAVDPILFDKVPPSVSSGFTVEDTSVVSEPVLVQGPPPAEEEQVEVVEAPVVAEEAQKKTGKKKKK